MLLILAKEEKEGSKTSRVGAALSRVLVMDVLAFLSTFANGSIIVACIAAAALAAGLILIVASARHVVISNSMRQSSTYLQLHDDEVANGWREGSRPCKGSSRTGMADPSRSVPSRASLDQAKEEREQHFEACAHALEQSALAVVAKAQATKAHAEEKARLEALHEELLANEIEGYRRASVTRIHALSKLRQEREKLMEQKSQAHEFIKTHQPIKEQLYVPTHARGVRSLLHHTRRAPLPPCIVSLYAHGFTITSSVVVVCRPHFQTIGPGVVVAHSMILTSTRSKSPSSSRSPTHALIITDDATVAFGNQYPFATAKLNSSCATAKIGSSVASSPGSPLGGLASWLGYGATPKSATADSV